MNYKMKFTLLSQRQLNAVAVFVGFYSAMPSSTDNTEIN